MDGLPPPQRDALTEATDLMRLAGVRRLLVLSGEADWSRRRAGQIQTVLPGDWLWVGESDAHAHAHAKLRCAPAALKTLLGREFTHGVFDASAALAVDALAALAGTLTAGSWLLLLVPEWTAWPDRADGDSLRWSGRPSATATPGFIHRFRHSLLADPEVVVVRQHQPLVITPLAPRPCWQPVAPGPTEEQRALLDRLLTAAPGIYVLTAARGRGKSTLAGMLAAGCPGACWITAPAKATAAVVEQYAFNQARFFAPDALLEHCRHHRPADWLLVDEAAAIPLPLLRRLIGFFPRVLLTTTVQGYEGTGRGFVLKFCASLGDWHNLSLDRPLRWARNDPLERWLGAALLFDDPPAEIPPAVLDLPPAVASFSQERWRRFPTELPGFYQLLTSAHYRTTPLDLRRIMDAPGQHFVVARSGTLPIGAVWLVDEGGLCPNLAHDVWAGRRRPPGNLVAQSLAAHGGLWEAPLLHSRRISRIAVTAPARRRGIGRALLDRAREDARGLDFMSVSFGYTDELWQFWRAMGFTLVQMGTHLEASSGCYSAMALLPLSDAGHQLTRRGAALYARDGGETAGATRPLALNEDDWRCLAGFACAHRPAESCQPALGRLVAVSLLALPALRCWLEQGLSPAEIISRAAIDGKKTLLRRWRAETSAALQALNSQQYHRWQAWSAPRR